MVGFATSFTRELMWFLATYAVRPGLQGRGIGQPLLEAALTTAGAACAGCSPRRATRGPCAATGAGFTLHPQMFLTGTVDRSTIPLVEKVREGRPATSS